VKYSHPTDAAFPLKTPLAKFASGVCLRFSVWLLVFEFQARHDPETLDVTSEEAARIQLDARRGSDLRGKLRQEPGPPDTDNLKRTPTMSEATPTDVHALYLKELIDARDWAGLARYCLAHQYGPALQAAINLVQEQTELTAFLTAVYQEPLDWERKLPEEFLGTFPPTERTTLDFLLMYPRMTYGERAAHYPPQHQDQLYQVGVEGGERCVELAQSLEDPALEAFCHVVTAAAFRGQRRLEMTRSHCDDALDIYRELAETRPDIYQPHIASTAVKLGSVQHQLDELEESCESCEEALEIYRELAKTQPEVYQDSVASTLNNLGSTQRDSNDLQGARASMQEALDIYRELARSQPDAYQIELATSLNNLGSTQRDLNELEAARANFQEALSIWRELALAHPNEHRPDLAMTLNNLGIVHQARNDSRASCDACTEALGIYRELALARPGVYRPTVAAVLINLGLAQRGANDRKAARASFKEARDIYIELVMTRSDSYFDLGTQAQEYLATVQEDAPDSEGQPMTEAAWLKCADPSPMIDFLCGEVSDRKLRLALCAGCRRIWKHLDQDEFRHAVEVGEQIADGVATDEARQEAVERANSRVGLGALACRLCLHDDAVDAARRGLDAASGCTVRLSQLPAEQKNAAADAERARNEKIHQAALLRDIFGNPFGTVEFDPAWRTSDVVALAQQMYDSRDFSAMPVLADALQDAGCEDEDIFDHCRGSGPHYRGCWVVDLVLGRK
jgi:tetratricopeptide (TPR) repeat protein